MMVKSTLFLFNSWFYKNWFSASESALQPNDFFKAWIRSWSTWIVNCYWLERDSQSVLSVGYLCVQGTLEEEDDSYSLSKPAVSLPYWCLCHHRLPDWLLDEHPPDWCDRQLAWCPNLLTPAPFHMAELSFDRECERCGVFSLQQPWRLTSKLLGLGFIQQAGWHQQKIDAVGALMESEFLPPKMFC